MALLFRYKSVHTNAHQDVPGVLNPLEPDIRDKELTGGAGHRRSQLAHLLVGGDEGGSRPGMQKGLLREQGYGCHSKGSRIIFDRRPVSWPAHQKGVVLLTRAGYSRRPAGATTHMPEPSGQIEHQQPQGGRGRKGGEKARGGE